MMLCILRVAFVTVVAASFGVLAFEFFRAALHH